MSNRMQRLEVLRVLLLSNEMGSHEEILQELARNGCVVTQATLSRDLNKLHAAKVLNGRGGYRYVLPEPRTLAASVIVWRMVCVVDWEISFK